MQMKTSTLFVFLFLPALWAGAQPVELNLEKCRQMALESSQKVQMAGQQELKAGYEQKAYRANFLPKLSGLGLYTYVQEKMEFDIEGGYLPVYDVKDVGQQLPLNSLYMPEGKPVLGADGLPLFKQYAFLPDIHLALGMENFWTVGLMLEQPLYMGGKVRSAYRMARVGKEMAQLNVRFNRTEVLAETDEAYWQYIRIREQHAAAGKYLEAVQEVVRNLEDASQTGMASRNDLLKAQVKQNEAELMVRKAGNGLELSRMNLCRLIGLDLYTSLVVTDSLSGEIRPDLWAGGDDIGNRPEYHLLEKQVELKEREVALTRSDFLPQLGVSASYGYSDGLTLNGESDGLASFMAMASLKLPIYHWGEGRSKVKAMKAEEETVRLKKEETAQLMLLEAAQARFHVEDASARVVFTRKSLTQAGENLQVSKNRYEVGMETLTDYLEAQAQWQKAWSDWIDAKAELRLSETYYLKATGRLTD